MNRNILTLWLPAIIITGCVILILYSSSGTDDKAVPDTDPVVTDDESTEPFESETAEVDDVDASEDMQSGANMSSAEIDAVDDDENALQKPEKFDRQRWENSGDTLTERLESLNIDGQSLPRAKGRTVLRPMTYQKDFVQEINKVRDQGLKENNSGAWATLQFKPEMIGEEVTGLRIDDIKASEFLEKNGLEYGDIIKEVNGTPMNTPEAAFNGMSAIGESDNLNLVIDRGGELQTIVIEKK